MKRAQVLTRVLCVVGGLAWVGGVGGCTTGTLFTDSDPYTQSRLQRYWGGDSARETTEARKRVSANGFGFPTGSGNE